MVRGIEKVSDPFFVCASASTWSGTAIATGSSSSTAIEVRKMPDKDTLKRAARDRKQGKSASTQAGEFVRQEMHHIREGKHGAKSTKQAIAIGLSEARRAGV